MTTKPTKTKTTGTSPPPRRAFAAHVADVQRRIAERRAALGELARPVELLWRHRDTGEPMMIFVASRDARTGGFRVTSWDRRGTPTGHVEYPSVTEIAREYLSSEIVTGVLQQWIEASLDTMPNS